MQQVELNLSHVLSQFKTIGLENEDEECDLNYMKGSGEKCTVKVALSNSLGFGGHNGTLAVKKYEK